MERDLPAFIAHRVRKLQTPRRLIEEIDIQPGPPPRPQPGKLKTNTIRCVSPAVQVFIVKLLELTLISKLAQKLSLMSTELFAHIDLLS
jgi:hypothetical protein